MFSDRYKVIDKYSLTTLEKVSTIEIMPRRYTSLVDSAYLPVLDGEVKLKMNKFFDFHQEYTHEFALETDKNVHIEHKDGDIIQFFLRYPIQWDTLKPIWNKFVRTTGLEQINGIRSKIDLMTSVTDSAYTRLCGASYDTNGDFNGVVMFDNTYDLHEYENDFLAKVNELPAKQGHFCKGFVILRPGITDISYRIEYNIFNTVDKEKREIVNDTNDIAHSFLELFYRTEGLNLLTDEQRDFAASLLTGDSWFDIEFLIGQEGECKDIFFLLHVVNAFDDLTGG